MSGRNLIIAAVLAALPAIAAARGTTPPLLDIVQSLPPSMDMRAARFRLLDTNGDGFISAREARSHVTLRSQFASLDANHDGRLSETEYLLSHVAQNDGARQGS